MKKNKILILVAIIILVYSISDYFFNDSIMYLIGGIIGGGLKLFGSNSNPIVFILTWVSILLIAIAIYYQLEDKKSLYIVFIIIAISMYVFDILIYEIMDDIFNRRLRYLNVFIKVLFKSSALFFIYYLKQVNKKKQ